MDFSYYQIQALRTARSYDNQKLELAVRMLGLLGEPGEVSEIIKKYLGHDQPLDIDKLTLELGDVLWYIAALCDTLGITLEDVAAANLQKLRERHPNGFSTKYHAGEEG